MEFGWLSLIPAIVTIVVALSTKRVALALFFGVIAGAFTINEGVVFESLQSLWDYLVLSFTDPERLRIVLFILLIGGMLQIIHKAGGYDAFAGRLS
ncbi:MAG: Na+/H+ antiporter NhaC family protein, partial [Bacteroidota bacterium]